MIRATRKNKKEVVAILSDSFVDNKSVLSTIGGKTKRIKALMGYAFETCMDFGFVYLLEDRKACALVILPDRKKSSFKSIWRDVILAIAGVGISNVFKILKREKLIRDSQYKDHIYHLWFIGVFKEHQNTGKGSALFKSVLKDAELKNRRLILETSSPENVTWYKNLGLKVYANVDLGYHLAFLST